MHVSNDLLIHKIWKYLPVNELRKYCSLNKEINTICNNPETWRFLLRRDFKIKYEGNDPEDRYEEEENYHKIKKYLRPHIDILSSGKVKSGDIWSEYEKYGDVSKIADLYREYTNKRAKELNVTRAEFLRTREGRESRRVFTTELLIDKVSRYLAEKGFSLEDVKELEGQVYQSELLNNIINS